MKYEYLKGSEKDFYGAPEWCTHVSKGYGSGLKAWEQADETKVGNKYQWANGESGVDIYEAGGVDLNIIAERQPITEPSWDGSGLPPVGCECEFTLGPYEPDDFDDLCGKLPEPGTLVNVVSHKVTGDGHNVAVIYWDEDGGGRAACFIGSCLNPIRSEADKKRDAACDAMSKEWRMVAGKNNSGELLDIYSSIYDAIAAGKIPGVKLED